jgi:glycosyltransferase involved in cell wall biosynthesis
LKILFLGPLPPPVNGHSIAAKTFLDGLTPHHDVRVVDLGVDSSGDGSLSWARIRAVLEVLWQVFRAKRGVDVIYLTISESPSGNLKDLLIYCICLGYLSRMYIHLHGGSIQSILFDRFPFIRWINAQFIARFAGVIICGPSHADVFADMIDASKIHTSANFAIDELFVDDALIEAKFADTQPLRLIYVSNMVPMKGFDELAEAYLALDEATRGKLTIDFAGLFDSPGNRQRFEQKIAGNAGLRYHGVVDGAAKRRIFTGAHVFCLPTAFKEGQPISILEAYAAGCVVVATGQPGIHDVFTEGVNGYEVLPRSVPSIKARLEALVNDLPALRQIARSNREIAGRLYRTASYQARLTRILEGGSVEA